MPAWALYLGVRKHTTTVTRYPLGVVQMTVLNPFFRLILPSLLLGSAFLVGGEAVGLAASTGTTDFAGFVFLGATMNVLMVGTLVGASAIFTMERETGTLEQCWTSPAGRTGFGFEVSVSGLAISAIGAVTCLAAGVVLFGVRLPARSLLAVPALLLSLAGLVGLGLMVLALSLRLRQVRLILDGGGFALGMLAGNIFPVAVLPAPLLAVASLMPMTYGIDLWRHYALGTRTLLPPWLEHLAAAGTAAALLAGGLWLYDRAARRVALDGELGQH